VVIPVEYVPEDIPLVDMPSVEVMTPVGQGTVLKVELGAEGFRVGRVGRGLRPPAPSSVEPSGIPLRPTFAADPIVGDEAEAAGFPSELPAVVAHVPDAVPAMPPPSNTYVDAELPAAEVPVPYEVPDIELPMPDEVPVDGTPIPKDACGREPPMPPHVVR
jgi:hypothetical protein